MADGVVRLATAAFVLLLVACAAGGPQRVECERMPHDAFDRCRRTLARQWGTLEVVDPMGFRIQTAWNAHVDGDRVGQKRATVFLDDRGAVVVLAEVRWLEGGLVTTPGFGEPGGDDALTGRIHAELSAALATN